jgi:hypothetical protein
MMDFDKDILCDKAASNNNRTSNKTTNPDNTVARQRRPEEIIFGTTMTSQWRHVFWRSCPRGAKGMPQCPLFASQSRAEYI